MCLFPICQQFVTMQFKPFQNHTQCATGHLASHDTITNANRNLVIAIPGMEMCWRMVGEIHKNNDSVKKTDLWHISRIWTAKIIIFTENKS